MRVGVVLDGRRPAAEIAELARLAETYGLSHVWLSGGARTKDHFVRLALAAAATHRIRLGPIALSPFEMHPVHIGLALLTLDEIAPGRACLVLGARAELAEANRDPRTFAVSNWFVWNVQETRAEAERLARRQLGFRLYYIRDIASSIGLGEAEARELSAKQPEMLRAIFQGREPWSPPPPVADRLIEHLTLTSDRRGLEACVGRLQEFERLGLDEIALAPHGDPPAALKTIGDAAIPTGHPDRASPVP